MLLFGIKLKKPSLMEFLCVATLAFLISSSIEVNPRDYIMTTLAFSFAAFLSSVGISPWGSIKEALVFLGVIIVGYLPFSFLMTYIFF